MLIREKIRQAGALLREFNLDCWVTFTRETEINGDPVLAFLAPGDLTWHSSFIVTPDGRSRAIVGRYDRASIEEMGVYDEVFDFVTGFKDPFQKVMRAIDPRTIGVNFSEGSEVCDGLTHGMYLTLQRTLGEIGMGDRMVSAERVVSALRERKSPGELASIREAIREAQEIFELAQGFIAVGRSEKEIGDFMKGEVRRRGLGFAWAEDHCPSVFTGPDTAEAHYGPTGRKVEPGHLVTMDFGVKVDGYCSDLQRTYYVARPGETVVPAVVQRGFQVLRQAVEAAKAAVKIGGRGLDVDAAARKAIVDAGYDEFPFGLGHQVGRFPHDGTALFGPAWEKYAQKPFRPLEAGMVFTLEPRLTVPGHGIVSLEEMIVVTARGAEWLSTPQTELPVLR